MSDDPDIRSRHCGDLAVEAIQAKQPGRDVWAELGGRPKDWQETAELYRRNKCTTLAGVMTVLLGAPISPRQARRGDVVMARGSLGICRGEVAEFFDATISMREVEEAWHC
jgi:hypothetical protein